RRRGGLPRRRPGHAGPRRPRLRPGVPRRALLAGGPPHAHRPGPPGDDAQLPGPERPRPPTELLMSGDTPLAAPQPAPCTGGRAGRTARGGGGGAEGPSRPGEHRGMGNGRAIALRWAAEGATVAVTDLDLGGAEETVAALAGPGLAIR